MRSNVGWSTLVAALVAIGLCTAVRAQTSSQVSEGTPIPRHTAIPSHTGWIVDSARLLPAAERTKLSDKMDRYHRETYHQLAVLTVPTLSGENIETFSLRVANAWALGYQGLDNGILVTIAAKERQIRIELGKGMERYISGDDARSIIASMTPAFAKGDYAGGLELGLERLMQAAAAFVIDGRSGSTERGREIHP